MSPTAPLRRSQRPTKPRAFFGDQAFRIQKPRRSTRIAAARKKAAPEETPKSGPRKSPFSYKGISDTEDDEDDYEDRSRFIADAASDTDSATDTDADDSNYEDDKNPEDEYLSADNLHYATADDLEGKELYDDFSDDFDDEYDLDDFVVGDGDEDAMSVSSEISLVGAGDDEEASETSEPKVGFESERKASISSSSTASSGLFVSEEKERGKIQCAGPIVSASADHVLSAGDYEIWMAMKVINQGFDDIAEDMMDALAIFSRRCNRSRSPLKFRFGEQMWLNKDLLDAMQQAQRLGLGYGVELDDGTLAFHLGPPSESTSMYRLHE